MTFRKNLSIASLLMASIGSAQAVDELDGLCDEFQATTESAVAAIGQVRIHRGPFDFEGARVVGCLKNTGEAPLESASLVFDNIQTQGGGGGTTSLSFDALDPDQVGRFSTRPFSPDTEKLERWGTTGIRLRALQTRVDNVTFATHDFAEPIEMAYPLLDLPESELQQTCTALEPAEQSGEVMLSELRMIETVAGEMQVVGCIANGTDTILADNHTNKVDIGYKAEAGEDATGSSHKSGFGGLRLVGPLESGRADVFASDFTVEQGIGRVSIQFYQNGERDGYYVSEPVGPEFSVER